MFDVRGHPHNCFCAVPLDQIYVEILNSHFTERRGAAHTAANHDANELVHTSMRPSEAR